MPEITTQTCTVYFADHRNDDSPYPPVILVHGAGGSRLDWSPQLRREPSLNLVAVDLPGHGKSPGEGRNHVAEYAADIAGLIDALEWPKAIIVGHSMGGAIAQTMALDTATKVAGIILVGTGAKLPVNPDIINRVVDEPEVVFGLFKKWLWGKNVSDDMRELGYQRLMETAPEITQGDYAACDKFDVRQRLGEIAVPTLVIGGTDDKMTPYKFSVYLQEQIINASLATVEEAGHMMALEQPEMVVEAVMNWLKTTFK
jgi:pimeloyl-ACP methyl ester carboxylesterase